MALNFRKFLLMAAPLVVLALMTPLAAQTLTYPLAQQTPTGGSTPGFNVFRGWEFTVTQDIWVHELGCNTPALSSNNQTVSLWDQDQSSWGTNTGHLLGRVTVQSGSGWQFESLASPIKLSPGTNYVVSVFSNSLYGWHSGTPSSWMPTGVVDYTQGRWGNQVNSVDDYHAKDEPGNQQGHADIGYTTTPPGPGLQVNAPSGNVTPVFAGDDGPGGNGIEAATFEIASNPQGGGDLTEIELSATGSGHDGDGFTEVAIYQDENANGSFDHGTDTLIGTPVTSFSGDDGTATFTVQASEQTFGTSESRDYFIVVKMSTLVSATETFDFIVSDITVSGGTASGAPSSAITGLEISTPAFVFTDYSPATPQPAPLGTSGNIVQQFEIRYPAGLDDKPTGVAVRGFGTANEVADLTDVELWYDSDENGTFDSGLDSLVQSTTFPSANGTVQFDLSSHPIFQAGDKRMYFVVYNLNSNGQDGKTFKTYVSAASGMTANVNGLPSPGVGGTAGLVIVTSDLEATLNGPGSATTVDNDGTGPTGDGELLCDVTLSAGEGGSWTVNDLIFAASGTGAHDAAFSELAVYEDTNDNGDFDGSGTDDLAAATVTAFGGAPDYEATFTLNNTDITAGTERRFFLVGKLNGTAIGGETFNARLEAINGTPPAGGSTVGVPTADSTALMIDLAVLTVGGHASQPADLQHLAGTALSHVIGRFTLDASNGDVDVAGITLTTGGSGDWSSHFDGTNGVEVWLDDGDGTFDDTSDTNLFSGGGGNTVNALFSNNVTVTSGSSEEVWVRVNLLDTALVGTGLTRSYTISVDDPADVSVAAGAMVVLGTPSPDSAVLEVVDVNVTSFSPLNDEEAGGADITIQGAGFESPFEVRIDGELCPGTPVVAHDEVTGLTVPPGSGSGLAIEITSGNLPPFTLTETFSYGSVGGGNGGTGSGDSSSGGGGCTAGANTPGAAALLALLALLGVVYARRRTRA